MTKAQQAYNQMLIQAVLDGHITQRQAKHLSDQDVFSRAAQLATLEIQAANRSVSTPDLRLDDK